MADNPVRVQLSRRKGWTMPPNTVKVDRSTLYGNDYVDATTSAAQAVLLFEHDLQKMSVFIRSITASFWRRCAAKTSHAGARSTNPAMPTYFSSLPTNPYARKEPLV